MIDKKLKPKSGDKISLIGPEGRTLPDLYEVLETLGEDKLKILGPDRIPMRVFLSRVSKIIRREGTMQPKEEANAVAEPPKAEVKTPPKVEPKQVKVETPKVEPKAEVKTEKKKVKKNSPPVLDLKEYCKTNGGENFVLLKKGMAKHSVGTKGSSYILINPTAHTYRTFNTYTYPGGIVSLGRSGNDSNNHPYPLAEKKTMTVKCVGKDGKEVSKVYHGKLTMEEKIEKSKKEGYQVIKF